MFKHKIIKYFLISALILFFLIFIAILRLSYKPLDITYFSNAYPLLQKQVSELYNIKSEKVYLKLDVFENEISLKVYNISLQNLNSKVSNVKAKEANITFKLTDIIKNKIEVNNITIAKGGLDIYDIKDFYNVNKLNNSRKVYTFNSLFLEEINVNIYENNKKIAIFTNSNLTITKNKDGIHIRDLTINNVELKDINSKNNFTLNNLKLIKKKRPNYTFKIEDIKLQNADFFLKNQYFKNINNILFKDIKFDLNLTSFLANVRGKIFLNNYKNNFAINGTLKDLKEFEGDITVDIDNLPIFTLVKNNVYAENKYKINNASSILFNGRFTAEIKNNTFKKAKVKIFSKLKHSNIYLTNLKNNSQINIKDISFEGQVNNNIYEIKKLNINREDQDFKITGIFDKSFKDFSFNIDIEKIKYNKINKFLNNSIASSIKLFDSISNVNIDQVKNLKLIISKVNNKTELTISNSVFENIELTIYKNMILNISSAKIIKKEQNIKLYSTDVKLEGPLGRSSFSGLSIISNNYNDIRNNLQLKTNVSTNYKFLNFILSEFNINQDYPKSLEGDISGFLSIAKKKKDKGFIYFFEGSLKNFYYKKLDNKDIPIVLNKFNGDFSLSNDFIKIKGTGLLNGSSSTIKILVNQDDILTANIESEAKPFSLDFLGKYNFIKKGNIKLKVLVTKNIKSKKWKADFNANLFSNEINIDFINYYKPINRRGSLSGILQFNDLELISVDDIDFFTEQILINANLLFKGQNQLQDILINRFIKDKNNFKANIKLVENKDNIVKITGDSLDLKSLMSFGSGEPQNITLNINVNDAYYDSIYFGNIFVQSQIKNDQFIKLKGNISNNISTYIRFENFFEEQAEHNKINIQFDDFGYFLNKSSISDAFLEGKGSATLYFKKFNLLNGQLEIANSSIKNNSFLARLLQLASFTGLLEILTNEGIPFDKITVNFTNENDIIKIDEAKFNGFSLGGNIKGFTNLDKKEVNLEGIIVPAYAINALLNKIPLIGQVITGIEGDGLIGVNFKVTGTYDEPNYNVNPLSILTPGILRSIFESFYEGNNEDKVTE